MNDLFISKSQFHGIRSTKFQLVEPATARGPATPEVFSTDDSGTLQVVNKNRLQVDPDAVPKTDLVARNLHGKRVKYRNAKCANQRGTQQTDSSWMAFDKQKYAQ